MKFVQKKKISLKSFLLIFLFSIFSNSLWIHNSPSMEKDNKIALHGGYSFETFKGQKNTSVYISVFNNTKENHVIKSVSTSLSKISEFHTSTMKDNINKMIKLEEIIIPANSSFFFQPGKKHIMVMNIKNKLNDGDEFDLEFTLENGSILKSKIKVLNRKLKTMNHM
jgi:periplasmic copper chaperone A